MAKSYEGLIKTIDWERSGIVCHAIELGRIEIDKMKIESQLSLN